jgi:hypothetical protein
MSQENINKDQTEDKNKGATNTNKDTNLEALAENGELVKDEDLTDETLEEPSFLEKWKNHRYLFFRATYTIFNTIWMVVMAVGGFIAWLIAMIAL